jgi:hypothetical protein
MKYAKNSKGEDVNKSGSGGNRGSGASEPGQPSQPPQPSQDGAIASGMDPRLVALKKDYTSHLAWWKMFAIVKSNVLQFAWRDAQVVL